MLSLIILTYNDELRLQWVLEGLCRQSSSDFEVIVVDDGGDGATEPLVRRYQNRLSIRYVFVGPRTTEFRAAKARNAGIIHSRCEQLLFLDGDMVPEPTLVETYQRYYRPDVLLYSFRRHLPEELVRPFTGEWDFEALWEQSVPDGRLEQLDPECPLRLFWGSCFSVSAATACAVGGLDEGYVGWGADDGDFAIRLVRAGLECRVLLHEGICVHLGHPRRGEGIPEYARERFERTAHNNIIVVGEPLRRLCDLS